MIQLKQVKRERRENVSLVGGRVQDIVRVLVIVMLDPDKLYSVKDVVATAWDPTIEPEAYHYQYQAIAAWAKKQGKGLSQTPDNVDEHGKKIRGQPAKWLGRTWHSFLADMVWNRAVDILNSTVKLHVKAGHSGKTILCFWDEQKEEVVQKSTSSMEISSYIKKDVLKISVRKLMIAASALCLVVYLFLFMDYHTNDSRTPVLFPKENAALTVEEYTMSRANRQILHSSHDPRFAPWLLVNIQWLQGKKSVDKTSKEKSYNLYISSLLRDIFPRTTYDPPSKRGG